MAGYRFSDSPCPRLQVTDLLFFRFAYPVTGYRRTLTDATVWWSLVSFVALDSTRSFQPTFGADCLVLFGICWIVYIGVRPYEFDNGIYSNIPLVFTWGILGLENWLYRAILPFWLVVDVCLSSLNIAPGSLSVCLRRRECKGELGSACSGGSSATQCLEIPGDPSISLRFLPLGPSWLMLRPRSSPRYSSTCCVCSACCDRSSYVLCSFPCVLFSYRCVFCRYRCHLRCHQV